MFQSLDGRVKSFLAAEKGYIIDRFHARLVEAVNFFKSQIGIDPGITSGGIMDESGFGEFSHKEYVTSIILGGRVSQWDMVGMRDVDYQSLDRKNGKLPLALFELRGLARMKEDEFRKVVTELGEVSRRAHSMAQRFQLWNHSQTPQLANQVLNHPAVRAIRQILPYLTRLETYNDAGTFIQLVPFVDRLMISEGYTEHARTGQPLSPHIHHQLSIIHARLQQALGSQSRVLASQRPLYREALDALQRMMHGGRAPQNIRASFARTDDSMRRRPAAGSARCTRFTRARCDAHRHAPSSSEGMVIEGRATGGPGPPWSRRSGGLDSRSFQSR